MAWTESGIYANVFLGNLSVGAAAPAGWPNWIINTNKFYLTNNTDTPAFQGSAASSIYAVTNEVNDAAGWPAGGVAASGLASGSADIVLNWAITGSAPTTVLNYKATNNVSVANTTLASPGAFGGKFYWNAGTTKYLFIAIYFGGTGYITTAGTFAITWASNVIATFALAA
jgi:hypothetical protein